MMRRISSIPYLSRTRAKGRLSCLSDIASGAPGMIADLDIYRAAKLEIDQYDADASIQAAMRADALLDQGDIRPYQHRRAGGLPASLSLARHHGRFLNDGRKAQPWSAIATGSAVWSAN